MDTVVAETEIPGVDVQFARQHQANGKAREFRLPGLHLADRAVGYADGACELTDAEAPLFAKRSQPLPKDAGHGDSILSVLRSQVMRGTRQQTTEQN